MTEQKFNSEKILIGQGRESKVYLWDGFAYKCFPSNYPKNLIDYEINIQNAIYAAGVPTISYYESEIPYSIKMDYLSGVHIGEKFLNRNYKDEKSSNPNLIEDEDQNINEKYNKALEVMMPLFYQIHSTKEDDIINAFDKIQKSSHKSTDFSIMHLNTFLISEINTIDIENSIKQTAIEYISDIKDEKLLCHMDYHFFNIMYAFNKYYVIDWKDSKIGNPILDYARSYVILYEFANEFSKIYLKSIKKQCQFDELDLSKAIYVMATHRLKERNSDKVKELIRKYK